MVLQSLRLARVAVQGRLAVAQKAEQEACLARVACVVTPWGKYTQEAPEVVSQCCQYLVVCQVPQHAVGWDLG